MPPINKKILIVDDSKTIQEHLRMTLAGAGFQVFCAFDTMQGMMMAQQLKPDLIVMDVQMPAGGGSTLFQRLKNIAHLSQVPVIVSTTLSDEEVNKITAGHLNVRYMQKPIDPQGLVGVVSTMLGITHDQ